MHIATTHLKVSLPWYGTGRNLASFNKTAGRNLASINRRSHGSILDDNGSTGLLSPKAIAMAAGAQEVHGLHGRTTLRLL